MSRWSLKDERWKRVAAAVKERDGHQCQQCGTTEDLTVDHVEAVVDLIRTDRLDQAYDPDYLVTLCRPCNSAKGAGPDGRQQIIHPRWAGALGLPELGYPGPVG